MHLFDRLRIKTLALLVRVEEREGRRVFYTAKGGTDPWAPLEEIVDPASPTMPWLGSSLTCTYVGGKLHVCATTKTGLFRHGIRRGGSWQFEDFPLGVPGRIVDLSSAVVDGELHVCATTDGGDLYHAIRHQPPRWLRVPWWDEFSNVKRLAEDDPGDISFIGCTELDGKLCVVANVDEAAPWATFRYSDGSWDSFTDLRPIVGDPGNIATVACAATSNPSWSSDLLHVVAQVARPSIWWPQIVELRFDGAWHGPFADIDNLQEASSWVACAARGSELDVFSYGYASNVWHGTERGDHQWQTKEIAAPPHEIEIIGEVECAVDVSSWTSFRALRGGLIAFVALSLLALWALRRPWDKRTTP